MKYLKVFRRYLGVLVCLCLVFTYIQVDAANLGDGITTIDYSDISAYINHYPIPSYSYDGGTVIAVEDLRNFGFQVDWNESNQSLAITPDTKKHKISGVNYQVYNNRFWKGIAFADVATSNVNVYLNGIWIPSCSINGYTMIKIEDLAPVGEFTWDSETRSAKLWIDWAGITDYVPLADTTLYRVWTRYNAKALVFEAGPGIEIIKNNNGWTHFTFNGTDILAYQNLHYAIDGYYGESAEEILKNTAAAERRNGSNVWGMGYEQIGQNQYYSLTSEQAPGIVVKYFAFTTDWNLAAFFTVVHPEDSESYNLLMNMVYEILSTIK